MLRRQLPAAIAMLTIFTVLTGVIYPLVVTAIGHVAFNDKAEGSLIEMDGQVVGSELIGQPFTAPGFFHPRPSAAGGGYDAASSAGSNLGPTNRVFLTTVAERVAAYRTENGLAVDIRVPVDAVTASASGLDPHISVANAELQAPRVAEVRGVGLDAVLELVHDNTSGRGLGFLGEEGVNVLELNIAVESALPNHSAG
jgi:K+-transporting ATPase ATPase C chain